MPAWLIEALADLTPLRAVSGAVGLFASSLIPWFLLVDNRSVQQFAVHARHDVDRWSVASGEAFRDTAALLLLLTTRPKGAMA